MAGNKERAERNKGKKNVVLKVDNLKHKININFKTLRKEKKDG